MASTTVLHKLSRHIAKEVRGDRQRLLDPGRVDGKTYLVRTQRSATKTRLSQQCTRSQVARQVARFPEIQDSSNSVKILLMSWRFDVGIEKGQK